MFVGGVFAATADNSSSFLVKYLLTQLYFH